jgi:putative membrane protein
MIVGQRRSPLSLLNWQRGPLVFFGVVGLVFVGLRHFEVLSGVLEVSPTPLAILGSGLAFFVGFRTNNAYARWWEGRRLWGGLVNATRMLSTQIASYLPWDGPRASETQRHLVLLLSAYIHSLRTSLRDEPTLKDPEILRLLDSPGLFTSAEREALAKEPSLPHALVDRIHRTLAREAREGRLPELALTTMDRSIADLLDNQGGAERIKRTPMPPAYGLIAHYLTLSFGLVFPLTLHDDLDLWVVPLNMLVAGSFLFVNELGRVLEDPFTTFWNGLPLLALSRTMEANARARLGDHDHPPLEKPDANGVLM